MIISDCDETFNYWEPLNFLLRGFGKQTWEYSPEYAIRSYAYLIPYYIIGAMTKALTVVTVVRPLYQFYCVRLVGLTGFTVLSELKLFTSLNKNIGNDIANWYLFLSTVSPGMSHAGVALLPSSFAMQCVTIATSYALDIIGSKSKVDPIKKIPWALFWFAVAGLVGWPFAIALSLPFLLYVGFLQNLGVQYLTKIAMRTLHLLLPIIVSCFIIDNWFYQRFSIIPLNIVLYNVFGLEGEGPEIFGVEPFSYYILNLLINFNLIFLLSLAGIFVNGFVYGEKTKIKCIFGIILPMCLWMAIFFSQPHKEERFLYPLYPLLLSNAALFLGKVLPVMSRSCSFICSKKIPRIMIRKAVYFFFLVLIGALSILRVINLIDNYGSSITIYKELAILSPSLSPINVCTGREWYHFPNSFFLPDGYRLKFVKSGFNGLLPGDFLEDQNIKQSTSSIPQDMNNKNIFSYTKLTPLNECTYYIDNSEPIDPEVGEPEIVALDKDAPRSSNGWELVRCEKLLNPAGPSSLIGKVIWLPDFLKKSFHSNVSYMNLCLSKRINQSKL